jgi:hypothetical protein
LQKKIELKNFGGRLWTSLSLYIETKKFKIKTDIRGTLKSSKFYTLACFSGIYFHFSHNVRYGKTIIKNCSGSWGFFFILLKTRFQTFMSFLALFSLKKIFLLLASLTNIEEFSQKTLKIPPKKILIFNITCFNCRLQPK